MLIEWLKKIFGLNNKRYDYQDALIDDFLKEHKELFKLYETILNQWNKEKYNKVLDLLNELKDKYLLHITTEDSSFYTYTIKKYNNEPEIKELLINKQNEMKGITRTLEKFLNKYSNEEEIKKEEFKEELEQIGVALTNRVKVEEEELYPLYRI